MTSAVAWSAINLIRINLKSPLDTNSLKHANVWLMRCYSGKIHTYSDKIIIKWQNRHSEKMCTHRNTQSCRILDTLTPFLGWTKRRSRSRCVSRISVRVCLSERVGVCECRSAAPAVQTHLRGGGGFLLVVLETDAHTLALLLFSNLHNPAHAMTSYDSCSYKKYIDN